MLPASLLENCTIISKPGTRLRSAPNLAASVVKTYPAATAIGFFSNDQSHPVSKDGYYQWVPVMDSNSSFLGYVRNDVCQIRTNTLSPEFQVRVMIQTMLDNDIVIANRIIFCNQVLAERAKRGEDVLILQNQVNAYTNRLNQRQALIQQNPTVLAVKKTMEDELSYAEYIQLKWLAPAINIPLLGLGVAPVVVVVAICALAVVLIATYAIVAKIYGPKYDEGKVDFEKLPALQSLIAKADPATAAKARAEIQSVHDQAAKNQAKIDSDKNSNTFETLAYVAAAALVAIPLMQANNSKPQYALPAPR